MHSFSTTLPVSVADAESAVRDALGRRGFGIVSEIDVATNLNNALGVDRPPLKILGACSPVFAQQALEIDTAVSLFLPCNVVLEGIDDVTRVSAVDPREMMDDPRFVSLAQDVAENLQAVIDELAVNAPVPS